MLWFALEYHKQFLFLRLYVEVYNNMEGRESWKAAQRRNPAHLTVHDGALGVLLSIFHDHKLLHFPQGCCHYKAYACELLFSQIARQISPVTHISSCHIYQELYSKYLSPLSIDNTNCPTFKLLKLSETNLIQR